MEKNYNVKKWGSKISLSLIATSILLTSTVVARGENKKMVSIDTILKNHPNAHISDLLPQLTKSLVSINVKDVSFVEFFDALQKSSGKEMFLSYITEDIDKIKPITIKATNITLADALKQALNLYNLDFSVKGNIVSINSIESVKSEDKAFSFQGIIVDKVTKEPIVGATVIVDNTTNGAITNDKGEFVLDVKIGQTLEISFVGMKQLKYVITKKDKVSLEMERDNLALDDVVVTGYGNIDKKSFTGNAKTIKGEDLLKVSRTNVFKAISALDPSFQTVQSNIFGSDPNAMPEVYIRGRSSLGNFELDTDKFSKSNLETNPNTPTFVIDGFETDMQKVYDLDPNRIQTLTILKDAAATAMYGSRAANGVVVITTIPPKEGEVRISYNLTTTIETPDLSGYNLMNPKEKLEAELLSGVHDYNDSYSDPVDYISRWNKVYIEGVDTDWMSLPLRTAFKHRHALTLEGGDKNLKWGFNLRYSDDDGVMKGSSRNNGGAEFFVNFSYNKLDIKNIVYFNSTWSEESQYGSFGDYSHQQPYSKYLDDSGNPLDILDYSGSNNSNPMYEALLNNFDKSSMDELTNNLQLKWRVANGFQVTGMLGITKQWEDNKKFTDPKSKNTTNALSSSNLLAGDLYTTVGNGGRLNARAGISYNKSLNLHNLNASVNAELMTSNNEYTQTHYMGFPSGSLSSINYASEVNGKPKMSESTSRQAGVSGVFNYSYDNIYLADASFRYEGSSTYGTKNKFAPYSAGGLGINIHNYDFMKSISHIIDIIKVRASFGMTGNVSFPAYTAQNYHETLFNDWYITGYGTQIVYLGNPDLKGETTNTIDAGIDLSMFDSRLSIQATFYNKTTVDMINNVTVPTSSGFNVYKDNMGKVRNKGFELNLYGTVIKKKDFSLSINANFAHNKNTVLEIAESLKAYNDRVNDFYQDDADSYLDPKYSQIFTKYEEGRSMTAMFGMNSLGIDPATGQEAFLDRAGNLTYEWNGNDMVAIGDTEPKGRGALGLNARYKQFTLSATFMYEFGGDVYNETLISMVENADIENSNVDKRVLSDRWQKPGDIAPLKDIKDRKTTTRPTSRFMQENNTLSLGSLSLQYEFNSKMIKEIGIERLRLEANCGEMFRLSSIKQERGLSYPFARNYNFSLMLNF